MSGELRTGRRAGAYVASVRLTAVAVSTAGIEVGRTLTVPVDVLFDGHRVWSTTPARDAVVTPSGSAAVPWPRALRPFLTGPTRVVLREHNSGQVLFDAEVAFGAGERVRVVDAHGHPVAVDKGGHLQRTFLATEGTVRTAIVDAVDRVITDLREECGLDAFLAYGCLLGAVRDGHMIGHDSDADVSYYSRHTHPFDVALENHRVARRMSTRGWHVVRMSGADFKIWVPLGDGRRCGVDVFTSFHVGEQFHLLPTLRGPLERSAVLPLSTVRLEGRELPAPADPAAVLALTYGEGWRVPDPSFRFEHPRTSRRRMSGWFRGPRLHQRYWLELHRADTGPPPPPTPFAHWVAERLEPGSRLIECGAGSPRDAVHLAGLGHRVTAVDYAGSLRRVVARAARRTGQSVDFVQVSFGDLRSVLVNGARFAAEPGPRHVSARNLVDCLDTEARHGFWRFARMVGGASFLEFRTGVGAGAGDAPGPGSADPDRVVGEIEERGGRVVHREAGTDDGRDICRLMVRWDR